MAEDDLSSPKSFAETLMEIVMLFADKWHTTPFEILAKDIDDFFLVANYLIVSGKEKNEPKTEIKNKTTRIKVNDKTATGGWF